MRDEYIKEALLKIDDPMILINVVSTRVKQLRRGSRALVESLEKLAPEDIALREIIENKISYELPVAVAVVPDRNMRGNTPRHASRD
jgi:DNA-directed RNA polymerase subunit omega